MIEHPGGKCVFFAGYKV